MKNRLTISILLIVPVFLFIISYSFKDYQGPYFTNSQNDPGYAYLISSLNLSQFSGYGVGHVDHPGTPVQVIGAIIIRLYYHFNAQENSLVRDVLLNSEKYLDKINYTFLILNCFGLFVLGVISYKVYSNVTISLLLQLTPFTSISILSLLTYVRPENFLIFVVCIFIAVLLLFVNEQNINNKKYWRYAILLGIISGLGVATKITFFPLVLIPLMLFRGIKFKLIFLLLISVSFLLFVFPAISYDNTNYFFQWVQNLFIYNKKYGRGEPTIIDSYTFLRNIKTIFIKEWFFTLAYFSIGISLILCLKPKLGNVLVKVKNIFTKDNKYRLAVGFFLAMTLQILIVAKHYGDNYMFPSLTISVFAIFTSISILSNSFGQKLIKRKTDIIYLMVIVLISVYGLMTFYTYGNRLKIITEESYKLLDYVEKNLDSSIIVSPQHVASLEFALFAGTSYAKSQEKNYKSILNPIYPSSIFYAGNKLYSFSDDTTKIENSFKLVDKIIILCPDESYRKAILELLKKEYGIANTTIEKLFSNKNGEMVYEIRFEPVLSK